MTRFRLLVVALLCATGLVFAACGSDDSNDDGGGGDDGSSTASAGMEKAQKIFDEGQTVTGFGDLPKFDSEIPSGKKIDFISCGPAACLDQPRAFREAGKVLGWETKIINGGGDPQANQNAMGQAVRDEPDAVLWNGLDSSVFKDELAELKAKDIPVVALQTLDPQDPPAFSNLPGETMYDSQAELTAASAVLAAEGKGKITFVKPPFPIYNLYNPKIEDMIGEMCPDCSVETFDMPMASLGTDATARIVNYLRSNPDVKTLIHDAPATASGLDAALQGASLTDIQSVVINASVENIPDIQSGKIFAGIPLASNEISWLAADALARIFTDQSPEVDIEAGAPTVIWTKDNVPSGDEGLPPNLPDYQQFFKDIWGK